MSGFSLQGKRVWVAGHTGLVGSALVRRLEKEAVDILTVPRNELDLRRQADVEAWMSDKRPDVVLIAAARVGGIGANSAWPADFIYDNLAIAQNVIHQAYLQKVEKLVFLGSSCIYPKFAAQPIREEELLTGALEATNEAYAIAKIAGLKMCEFYRRQYGCDFISLMPCNLYGPGDRWDERTAHVIPALMMRLHQARLNGAVKVDIWGSGTPLREFLYVDDLAEAVMTALYHYQDFQALNAGSGEEISIGDLAKMIAEAVGYKGALVFDMSKPDGTPRKIMDSGRLRALGWAGPSVGLQEGLTKAYADYLSRAKSDVRISTATA